MKVGYYLDNTLIKDADLRYPEKGNPGIGGTQYLLVATPYYINKYFSDMIEVKIYAHYIDKLPNGIDTQKVSGICDALSKADAENCYFFVFPPFNKYKRGRFYEKLSECNSAKGVAWAHNTPDIFSLNRLYKNNNLSCFLCCSQEQYDRLRDHPIIYKSVRIFNGFDTNHFKPDKKVEKEGKRVAYIGSITPAKGFHWLAQVWPKILEQRPDAELIVMGSGKLYDSNAEIGKWGIAAEEYEKNYIRPYLGNGNGKPHPSVKFMGLVGNEKVKIMQNVDVGVINPSGKTENCPGSALEFQAAGTPIVSSAKRGILDTVVHKKTGLLGDNKSDLIENILRLLNDQKKAREYGQNGIRFVENKFNWQRITQEWFDLFERLSSEKSMEVKDIKQFPNESLKWLREDIRKTKERLNIKSIWLSLHSLIGILKFIKSRF